MQVTATFIGKYGSLGYKKGKEYKLSVMQQFGSEPVVLVEDKGNEGEPCKYGSIIAFLGNWDNIKTK